MKECFHHLKKVNDPPYKYQCVKCRRKLKIASGLVLEKLKGVGFYQGAGVPQGKRVNAFFECGCCGAYHRTDFWGDCREDSERHSDIPDDAIVVEQ